MQSIVAFQRLEPTFSKQHAVAGLGVEPDPAHTFGVRHEMSFAHQHGAQA